MKASRTPFQNNTEAVVVAKLGASGRIIASCCAPVPCQITPEILSLNARVYGFKGTWRALGTLAPDQPSALRRVATIESIGSFARIEDSKLSDRQDDRLLSNVASQKFGTHDEQEVAGHAGLMDLMLQAWADMLLDERHLQRRHQILLQHSAQDEWFRGPCSTVHKRRNQPDQAVPATLRRRRVLQCRKPY